MNISPLLGLLRCPVCRATWTGPEGCCSECLTDLFGPFAPPPLRLPGLIALGHYGGRLAEAIRAYKFGRSRKLSVHFATRLAVEVQERGWTLTQVAFVPLHPARLRRRGFDQARLLAQALAPRLSVPCRPLLERTRRTAPQARLSARERLRNVQGSFAPRRPVEGTVLLVDDVFTTGATLGACSNALYRAGAGAVLLAVLAVALPRRGVSEAR